MVILSFLEDKIRKASQSYYSGEDSGMTDEEFDKYMNRYREECPEGELLDIGHGYDVNKDSTPGKKYKHIYGVAGSLDKAYVWSDFNKAISSGCELHASLKLDGLSVVLYYRRGHLYRALTRGDGKVGIDITEVATAILGTDHLNKDKKFTGAVRGEILMTLKNFEEFQKLYPNAKNPRNSAAGLINSNKVCPDLQFLDIYVYTVVGIESMIYSDIETTDRRIISVWLSDNFDCTAPYDYIWISEIDFRDEMNSLRDKWYPVGIPADGIVLSDVYVKIVHKFDIAYEIVYDSQAFKFPSEAKQVTVTSVEWNMTKNRRLVPVINFDSVMLAGTSVQRATGNNAKFIETHKIGVGAVIEVSKHGEIIPNVNRVIQPSDNDLDIPSICPVCGEKLVRNGVDLLCEYDNCPNAITQDLLVWLNKLAPIDGLGEKLTLKFLNTVYGDDVTVEKVMITDIREYLQTPSTGAQENTFRNMLLKLHSDRFSLGTALEALNIPRLGPQTASKLQKHPEIVTHVLDYADTSSEAYVVFRDALGVADAKSVSNNLTKFKRLKYIISRIDMSKPADSSQLQQIPVAITGKLSVTRSAFAKELAEHGYKVADISKSTKFLITDDPNSASSKNKKADKLRIVKISEEDFRSSYL